MATPISDLRDVCGHPGTLPPACPDRSTPPTPADRVCRVYYPGDALSGGAARTHGIHLDYDVAAIDREQHWRDANADVQNAMRKYRLAWEKSKDAVDATDPIPALVAFGVRQRNPGRLRWSHMLRNFIMFWIIPATIAYGIWLAWKAATTGVRLRDGDITLASNLFPNIWLPSGPLDVIALGVGAWILVMALFSFMLFLWRRGHVDAIEERIGQFFDVYVDKLWIEHLKSIMARLGDGDRKEKQKNTPRKLYHLLAIWRRIERFSAKLEPALDFYLSTQRLNRFPTVMVYVIYTMLLYIVALITVPIYLDTNDMALSDFGSLMSALQLLWLVFFVLLLALDRFIHRNAMRNWSRVVDATLLDRSGGVSEREKRFAELDPYPVIIERYRSDLDDLRRLIK